MFTLMNVVLCLSRELPIGPLCMKVKTSPWRDFPNAYLWSQLDAL